MVKTSPSNAGLPVQRVQVQFLVRGLRYHVPKNQDAEQKQCCKKFNEDFKNDPHQKILKRELY